MNDSVAARGAFSDYIFCLTNTHLFIGIGGSDKDGVRGDCALDAVPGAAPELLADSARFALSAAGASFGGLQVNLAFFTLGALGFGKILS